jgi:hypothetical protein
LSGRAQRSLVAVRENEDAAEAIAAVKEKRKPRYKSW